MDRLTPPRGYNVSSKEDVERILATEAELLRSEGIEPTWQGIREQREPRDQQK